ncbi:hypothetical protein VSDG_06422 [Cytospora chrysosperma]|uniref:Urease accessory protein UreD n=1 Tax=Cytospora chrysosperma TaxID=252740 RepID=A0A423VPA4_CYTCH|nr:hypothetical protein VSDG_06422 [Valsa sordida]
MPHKHTRKDNDDSTYDLPPNQVARPLPVVAPKRLRHADKAGGKAKGKGQGKNTNKTTADDAKKPQGVKRKRGADMKDDAPRAFKRLMAFAGGQKFRSGLDDGIRKKPAKNNKNKAAADAAEAKEALEAAKKAAPTIQPGESMGDFARRVDAALPVMGLVNSSSRNGKDPLGLKIQRTRKERKMHKLYDEWKKEELAIQEKRREEAEEAEEEELENDTMGVKWRTDMEHAAAAGRKKKKGKGKGARSVWESGDVEDDPWAELKKKRGEKKIGLHDHVKAPPELKNKPKEVLRSIGGATVDVGTIPKAAGSLKRREELQEVREEVVAAYRKLMEGKRARQDDQAS